MSKYVVADLKLVPVIPGASARFIHGKGFTIAFWEIQPGGHFPPHSHIHEMTVNVRKGRINLKIHGGEVLLRAGESYLIEPDVVHEALALEYSEVIDVFTPVREDYRKLENEHR
jgi:quercetin dioxygenase-like cupin family protein